MIVEFMFADHMFKKFCHSDESAAAERISVNEKNPKQRGRPGIIWRLPDVMTAVVTNVFENWYSTAKELPQ